MQRFTLDRRASGVLLHPTSLPGPHGVGDLGPGAERFAAWLAESGQAWWQMLPMGPPGGGGVSPYYATSAFAGNPLLISLDRLAEDGLLGRDDLIPRGAAFADERVRFGAAGEFKLPRLRKALRAFETGASAAARDLLDAFRSANCGWLPDFALFCALKDDQGGRAWTDWPADLRRRVPSAVAAARDRFAAEVRFHEFLQFVYVAQWSRLREACRRLGVGLVGDMPIFVAHDSAEVWSNPELFCLDAQGRQTVQAGVPPDYFSATGQLWGNPLYRWDRLQATGYEWWLARLRAQFVQFDLVRLDHFIGFHRCWEIPFPAKTAERGRWVLVPGRDFLETVRRVLGRIPLIAEDLGLIVREVEELRDRFEFPGMRVLQFNFGTDAEADKYRPHSYPRRCVVYTGTHDNDTTVGWFRDPGTKKTAKEREQMRAERALALHYLGTDGREIHWDMLRLALQSVADLAIIPMQDVLGLGTEARMNVPGTTEGNWDWRMRGEAATPDLARRLFTLTKICGRLPARG